MLKKRFTRNPRKVGKIKPAFTMGHRGFAHRWSTMPRMAHIEKYLEETPTPESTFDPFPEQQNKIESQKKSFFKKAKEFFRRKV